MEKLWSPWRSNYIQSFKDKDESELCVFCNSENKELNDEQNLIVHKGKLVYVTLNLYPYNGGHLMVIPYRHISNILELTKEENSEIMEKVQLSIKALDKFSKPHGYNVGANLGKAAGAGIDAHLHFHVLPRWIGDTNFMPAIGEVKVISQDLLEMKKSLISAYLELESKN